VKSEKIIIYDFDGTIADSAPIIRSIYADLAIRNKWRAMTDEDYAMLRKGSLREARRWAGIRWWQFPLVLRSAKRLMHMEAENVSLFPEITELIQDLHTKGIRQYVLSRNSTDTIKRVLSRYGLNDELQVLQRRKRTFGSKAATIRRLVKQESYDKSCVWMVGDEVRDVEAAKLAGVNSIAVSWGLQDISILELTKPDHMVTSVRELRKVLHLN
jgi:phosphoglycolate phosphatase